MPKNKQAHGLRRKDGPPALPNRDLFHRLNYTLQASAFLQNLGEPSNSASRFGELVVVVDRKGKTRAVEAFERAESGLYGTKKARKVARESIRSSKRMSAHNQLKIDPSFKRAMCKVCGTVLIPGVTSRIRNRPDSSHLHKVHTTCLTCSSVRSIPAPPIPNPITQGTGEDSVSDKELFLDGPVRARRRDRLAQRNKPAFHDREAASSTSVNDKGHSLWSGESRVGGWGSQVIITSANEP